MPVRGLFGTCQAGLPSFDFKVWSYAGFSRLVKFKATKRY